MPYINDPDPKLFSVRVGGINLYTYGYTCPNDVVEGSSCYLRCKTCDAFKFKRSLISEFPEYDTFTCVFCEKSFTLDQIHNGYYCSFRSPVRLSEYLVYKKYTDVFIKQEDMEGYRAYHDTKKEQNTCVYI